MAIPGLSTPLTNIGRGNKIKNAVTIKALCHASLNVICGMYVLIHCAWFQLVMISTDDWTNFKERMLPLVKEDDLYKKTEDDIKDTRELRLWASYRGQTLARTGQCR